MRDLTSPVVFRTRGRNVAHSTDQGNRNRSGISSVVHIAPSFSSLFPICARMGDQVVATEEPTACV
jgi:hypothetical protein